jgi:hypothetical protein
MRRWPCVLFILAFVPGAGCSTYQTHLARAQHALEQGELERTLAICRALEPDLGRLAVGDRARYAYLRGTADRRVGYKTDARHWLALATSLEREAPGSLPPDWTQSATESLSALNEEVYAAGPGAIADLPSETAGGHPGGEASPKAPAAPPAAP